MPFTTFLVCCILFVNHTLRNTPRTIPDRSAKLLYLQRLLRTLRCRSPMKSLPGSTPFRNLIFRTLNAFLWKQNNTHGYFRNSRLYFAYVERRMISLDSSNLVLARMIIMEAVTARMRMTVNPLPPPSTPVRFKGVHCTRLSSRGSLRHGFTYPVHWPDCYAMLVSSDKCQWLPLAAWYSCAHAWVGVNVPLGCTTSKELPR